MHIREFLRTGNVRTLLVSWLYFDLSFVPWLMLGVLGVYVAGDFGLTSSQKGLMVALPILGGTLVRIPMGLLVDRIGARRTGLIGQGVVFVPLLWGWLAADSFPQVLGMGLLLGVAGGSFAVALPLASRWYPREQQGLALGIAGTAILGTALNALLAPRVAEAVGWHATFGLALIPMTVVLLLFAFLAKESPNAPPPKPIRAYLEVFRQRDAFRFCIIYGFTFGGFVGLASFLVIFFHDQYLMSKVAAGQLTALCVLIGGLMRSIGGLLADRFGGVRILTVVLSASVLLLGALALLPPPVLAVPALMLLLGAFGIGNGSLFQLVPQRFQREMGVATGVIGAAGGLGGFLLPNVLSFFMERRGNFGAGFATLALAGLVVLILVWSQRISWSRRRFAAESGG